MWTLTRPQQLVVPDLGTKCLTRLSAEDTGRLRAKDTDGMANTVKPDQTFPTQLEAVLSGFALFVQAFLSIKLGCLW